MSVRYKVHALLAQWVFRYATAPNTWAHMMFFWLFGRFGVDPQTVIATPFLFLLAASDLPAFYRALLRAWTGPHGSLPQVGLFVSSANTWLLRADPLTCQSCYQGSPCRHLPDAGHFIVVPLGSISSFVVFFFPN